MIEVGLIAAAIAVSISGYSVVKRSKRIEHLYIKLSNMSMSIF